jgi:hypothetical protein
MSGTRSPQVSSNATALKEKASTRGSGKLKSLGYAVAGVFGIWKRFEWARIRREVPTQSISTSSAADSGYETGDKNGEC